MSKEKKRREVNKEKGYAIGSDRVGSWQKVVLSEKSKSMVSDVKDKST